jgi:uncharacterized protein (TIGR00645 family)
MKPTVERILENGLFASRWLMAPFYVGLVASLLVLMVAFFQELIHELMHVMTMTPDDAILLALSLIDLSLAANLVLIVIFSGYENFVSKIDVGDHVDKPEWMGTVDFSGLKLKLIASIVAISGIALLRAFLEIHNSEDAFEPAKLMWMVIVHLTFVASGVLLALMDLLTSKSKKH